jgi:predicted permease
LNWSVLAAASALSLLTGLLFGLAPALQATRVDVIPALKEARAGQQDSRHGFRRFSLSQVLVASQLIISLLLLVAAGLFARTLSNLQSIQLGFNRENVLVFQLNARQAGHADPEIFSFYSGLQNRFRAIPGVIGASASHSPLLGSGTRSAPILPVGRERKPGDRSTHILMTAPDFFETMRIPVLFGRGIDERDQPGSPPVAVVSEAYAKKHFGDRNPLGERIYIRRRPPLSELQLEIVGVAANVRYGAMKGEFREIAYFPFNQGATQVDGMTFALKTSGDPLQHVNTVREIVRQADARVPVTGVKTQAAQIDQTMNQEIIFARLCTAFAVLALLIACVGLYGTMAYAVERRTGEIGIRMALGALRGDVIWMVLRKAFALSAIGLAIGVPLALATSKFVKSFLFGVEPNDASALLLAGAILLCAVILAAYVPARRASRIDPMSALRQE